MNIYKILFSPFYRVMNRYVSANKKWTFAQVKLGRELEASELEAIHEFRLSCYKEDAPYLIPSDESEFERERAFDLNSYHIVAKNEEGNIVGTLRLLKRPFEMEQLNLPENAKQGLDEYLEISRLVCSERKQGLGRRLLIMAGLWSIQQTTYRGFTAICKCHRLPMFRRFGLAPKASFPISERGGQTYHLIRADFSHISAVTLLAYVFIQVQNLLIKKPLL